MEVRFTWGQVYTVHVILDESLVLLVQVLVELQYPCRNCPMVSSAINSTIPGKHLGLDAEG